TFAEAVLAPTRIYVKSILALMRALPVKGLAHITGGGLVDNVPRILQPGLKAVLEKKAWPLPPLFQWLQAAGKVADAEMHRVFNCGIGMVIVLAPEHAKPATGLLTAAGEQVFQIGRIEQCASGEAQTVVV
ncbi:MAG: phosphoribosylformylglycinamidine cyclo-ligase, partial [Zoogloeaceae bacterium]|nr:phosphoribosylformylglycinamidine cyclo-ligase [Zoogloeaceae bacterium]